METYFKLDTSLARADASSFASGKDWQTILTDRWDQFCDKLNGVYKPNATRSEICSSIEASAKILTGVIEAVETRLDAEMKILLNK
jgi:hypothetical protein